MAQSFVLRDVPLANTDEAECVRHILSSVLRREGGWLVTVNTDILRRIEKDSAYRHMLTSATHFVADGMPLVWASRIAMNPLPERVAGSSLLFTLSEAAAKCGRSVFLLGGNPGTADTTAKRLVDRYPGLTIAGTLCPPFGFMSDDVMMEGISEALRRTKPDIVFVALGCPLQDEFIASFLSLLPHAWWIGVGVSFSFAAGETPRAPMWMQRLSLEWLHRLTHEPKRLARRYMVDDLPYAVGLLAEACAQRIRIRTSTGRTR